MALWLLTTGALVYAGLVVFALLCSDGMIFPGPPVTYEDNDTILKLPLANGDRISALWRPCPGARWTVLYSHGNYEDLGQLEEVLQRIVALGCSVLAYDYPGYGTSDGTATETSTCDAVRVALDFLGDRHIPPSQVIAWGRSVGGGPSLDLASSVELGGVILEATFTTAFRVQTHVPIVPFDKFPNIRRIGQVGCPVLVIHGARDGMIKLWHGQALYNRARQPKRCLWIEGGHHNDLFEVAGSTYTDAVAEFLQLCTDVAERSGGPR